MNEVLFSNFLLVLGYLFYDGYLKSRGEVKVNRYFLIGWILLSMLIPFLPSYFSLSVQENVESIGYTLPTIDVTSTLEQDSSTSLNWWLIGYGIVSLALIVRFATKWISISSLVSRAIRTTRLDETIYVSHEVEMPFTFMNKIVIPTDLEESELPFVLKHEHAHVKAYHGIDLVFIHFVQALNWFNPVVWFLEKAIRMNHEFEADQAVLSEGSTKASDYKALLLSRAMSVSGLSLSHAMADESQLQKRFLKMNKKIKNNPWKYLTLVPVLAFAFTSKAIITSNEFPQSNVQAQNETHKEVDVMPEFPGGQQEMMMYMVKNVRFPEEAKEDSLSGRVFVQFIVTDKGQITKTKVLKSDNEVFNAEALRVINSMPDWKPGEKDGKPVNTEMVLPLMFKLD